MGTKPDIAIIGAGIGGLALAGLLARRGVAKVTIYEQAKEFHFVKLCNGRLTIQPTDHIVFRERSFTVADLDFPKGLKRQTEIWSCE